LDVDHEELHEVDAVTEADTSVGTLLRLLDISFGIF
jgi:hypothetical protein